jgi:hypothetical protein
VDPYSYVLYYREITLRLLVIFLFVILHAMIVMIIIIAIIIICDRINRSNYTFYNIIFLIKLTSAYVMGGKKDIFRCSIYKICSFVNDIEGIIFEINTFFLLSQF